MTHFKYTVTWVGLELDGVGVIKRGGVSSGGGVSRGGGATRRYFRRE